MSDAVESVQSSRPDTALLFGLRSLQIASALLGVVLLLIIFSPTQNAVVGRTIELTISVLWLIGLGGLTRTPAESRVRPIGILAFLSYLLGLTFSVLPTELFGVTSREVAILNPASLQLAFFALLLVSVVALLTAMRRLVLWLGDRRRHESFLWVSRVLRGAIILLLVIWRVPMSSEIALVLTIVFGMTVGVCCIRLSILFGTVRRGIAQRGLMSLPQVFD